MSRVDFSKYCEAPFNIASPVCNETEGLILLWLRRQWVVGNIRPIQEGTVQYGQKLVDLQTTKVTYLEYPFSWRSMTGINCWLVLTCEGVPELEGMATTTMKDRRVLRPIAGGAIFGLWGDRDQQVLEALSDTGIIEPEKDQNCLSLYLAMMALCGQEKAVGKHFENNVLEYSRQYDDYIALTEF